MRDDRWWLETVRSCTEIAGETSCPTGGARWTLAVTGREAFSDAAPIPLELIGAVERKGLTLVALELYFKRGRAKVRIGLARGKKLHDKRADLKARDDAREMQRALRVR